MTEDLKELLERVAEVVEQALESTNTEGMAAAAAAVGTAGCAIYEDFLQLICSQLSGDHLQAIEVLAKASDDLVNRHVAIRFGTNAAPAG